MSDNPANKTTRRDFIRNSALTAFATAAAASVMPTTAAGMRRVLGANDRIRLGHIGCGTQGFTAHTKLIHQAAKENNTEQIAASDLWGVRLGRMKGELSLSDSALYPQYEKLLENKDVDAVIVATSDNWHAPVAIAAIQAGKHVYCEKPLCKDLDEGFKVYDTVKKSKQVFQVGAQRTSDPKYQTVADMIKKGGIGHMIVGQCCFNRGDNKKGEWNDYGDYDTNAGPTAAGEEHVDWERFRRGTEPAAWDMDRFFRWRKYWAYGSGVIGDLIPHPLHPLYVAMGIPMDGTNGFPRRVMAGGGLYVQKLTPAGKVDREVPDFMTMTIDFGDYSIMAMSSTVTEDGGWPDQIVGNKATIQFGTRKIDIKPQRAYSDEIDESSTDAPGDDKIPTHHKNFFDCIRTGKQPNAHIDLAIRVQVALSLAERSYRENKTFIFDPVTRKATSA